mmetsp:Transcript_16811/g.44113  ORF Transcript_16811/g.44113 Transcript_16811/m.44113 type:complete len:201 (-) Transcript_16811:852-1454(-)
MECSRRDRACPVVSEQAPVPEASAALLVMPSIRAAMRAAVLDCLRSFLLRRRRRRSASGATRGLLLRRQSRPRPRAAAETRRARPLETSRRRRSAPAAPSRQPCASRPTRRRRHWDLTTVARNPWRPWRRASVVLVWVNFGIELKFSELHSQHRPRGYPKPASSLMQTAATVLSLRSRAVPASIPRGGRRRPPAARRGPS